SIDRSAPRHSGRRIRTHGRRHPPRPPRPRPHHWPRRYRGCARCGVQGFLYWEMMTDFSEASVVRRNKPWWYSKLQLVYRNITVSGLNTHEIDPSYCFVDLENETRLVVHIAICVVDTTDRHRDGCSTARDERLFPNLHISGRHYEIISQRGAGAL